MVDTFEKRLDASYKLIFSEEIKNKQAEPLFYQDLQAC